MTTPTPAEMHADIRVLLEISRRTEETVKGVTIKLDALPDVYVPRKELTPFMDQARQAATAGWKVAWALGMSLVSMVLAGFVVTNGIPKH